MKILMINKFLYPNGGSETYVFKLGEYLTSQGNEVQYFGMEHEGRIVGNHVNAYTSDMDFRGRFTPSKLSYLIKTIYSVEARKKIRAVLEDFQPDVCHLNNFNYQLTPSIILEIRKWSKDTGKKCRIVYTAHDYQLICPNHMCNNPVSRENCDKCLSGKYINCMKARCIHGNLGKSVVGMLEAYYWNFNGVYKFIDKVICCSNFMKKMLDRHPVFSGKTEVLHNFIDSIKTNDKYEKEDYVVYFGRFDEEKGIKTLLEVCKSLPEIKFIFAGCGSLEKMLDEVENVQNVGFKKGDELRKLVSKARFSVYPSEWYENCPFAIMESQIWGTPVIASDIGGIPDLIEKGKTGELFESKNVQQLREKILLMWENREKLQEYTENCKNVHFNSTKEYYDKLMDIYGEEGQ